MSLADGYRRNKGLQPCECPDLIGILGTYPWQSAGDFFMYYTYILYSHSCDRYYVGHCADMDARLRRHNAGMVKSTRPYLPWELKHMEVFSSRAEASARERRIKSMKSRLYIEQLIKKG